MATVANETFENIENYWFYWCYVIVEYLNE